MRITGPRLQPLPQPQPSPAPPLILPSTPEPPPTTIPPLGGRPSTRQSRYKLPVCKDPILPPSPPKPPDMPIYPLTQVYQPLILKMNQ